MAKSIVELFIDPYIKQRKRSAIGVSFLKKAIQLIDAKLDNPCCPDYDGDELIFATPRENQLTKTLEYLLSSIPKAGNVHSLTRARNKLETYLYCCNFPAPDAPTEGVVDDDADTFAFTSSYPLDKLEFTIDGGVSYSQVTENPLTGLTGDIDAGDVGVRVKAEGNFPPSATLFSTDPFTAAP